MPNSASIAAYSIDLEHITTLAGILNTTADNVPTANTIMENQLVYNLATEITGEDIQNHTESNIYTSQQTESLFFANEIDATLRSKFDVVTSPNLTDGNFALAAQYVDSNQVYDSVSNLIGNDIAKDISVIAPMLSIYDSFINVTSTDNNGPFHDENERFLVTFDASNSNSNIIRALNSRYTTIDNSDPLSVDECPDFNQQFSYGQNINAYFILDPNTGEPLPQELSSEFQANSNGFTITVVPEEATNSDNIGTYKIEQTASTAKIAIAIDNIQENDDLELKANQIKLFPIFNSTLGLDGSNNLPQEITYEEYSSAFDIVAEPWSIVSGNKVEIVIEEIAGSGYFLHDAENNSDSNLLTDEAETFTLNSSNLVDNFVYMQDYVLGSHKIEFSDATLYIDPNENGSTNNESNGLFAISNDRECLAEEVYQDHGQIRLNINSVNSRVIENQNSSDTLSNILAAQVVYNDEDGLNGRQGIQNDLKTNSYVQYVNKLVVKKPANDVNYSLSNGASFNLFNGSEIVNSIFGNYIQFINQTSVDDNTLEIIKINAHQVFITEETNALIANATDTDPETVIPSFNVSGIVTNFNSLVTTQTLDRMQINLALKPLAELSIYNDAANAGWQITNYYHANDCNKLSLNTVSSSNISSQPPKQVYDEGNNRPITFPTKWPNIWKDTQYYNGNVNSVNEVGYMINNQDSVLNYSIALIPVPQNGVLSPIFTYNLSIIWGINTNTYTNKIRYETPPANIFTENIESVEIVDSSTYQYINTNENTENNVIVGSNIVLVKTTYITEIQLEVPLNLLPYEGLFVKTPQFAVKYTAYKLKYTDANGKISANIDNLAYVVDVNNTIDYTKVQYIVNQQNVNTPLVFTGSLASDDFKELNVNVAAINSDDSMVQISEDGKANAFYGNALTLNLLQDYDNNPVQYDIIINMGGTSTTPLINETGYKVRIVVQPEVSYDVQHFEYAIENLESALQDNAISVSNGYANISNWDASVYSITTDTDENGTTVLTIIDSATSDPRATITTSDWKYLNTQTFITLCNNDIWKIHKYIGSSEDNTHTSVFAPINYEVVQGDNIFNNTFSPDAGVYVVGNGTELSLSSISNVGYVYDFTLKQDSISVNLVGNANEQLSPITDFTYQYVNGNSFSKTLTLLAYRGYYGVQSVDQVYTIERAQLTATFLVTTETSVVAQTFNVYKDKTVIVNDLIDESGDSIGGIGLSITFFASMLDSEDLDSFNVYILGDSVNINLTNTNYESFTPVNISLSLADYELYTFSGENFNSTNGPLKLNSARLKVKNNAFVHTKAEYSIFMGFAEGSIKFLTNYLGDPQYANWDNAELLFSAEYANWLLANNGGYGYGTGNNAQNHTIQFVRTPNVQYSTSVSYVVIAPPYLKFTQYGNFTQETDLPYDPSVNANDNLVYRYLPISIENNMYNPFETKTVTYSDDETQITVAIDSSKTNNASFQYINNKSIVDYIINPNYEPNKIVVNGNYYEIKVYLGLKNSNSSQYLLTLFNDESNKLLNLPPEPNSGDFSLVDSINNNSGAVVSFMQKHILYNNGITLEDIFADTNVDPNNIQFRVESFFLQVNDENKNIDLRILQGINVSLYTKKLVMDQHGNMNIKVYKYLPFFNGINQTAQVTTIFYNSREVKTIPVPSISLTSNTVPNWNTLLESISYETVSDIEWESDETFNSTNNTTYVSVVNLTVESASVIQTLLLACEPNGIKKITLVNKEPLLRIVNKIGMPIMEIDGNGVIKTTTVSTNSLMINPIPGESINSSISNYPLYSILGNSIDNVL